MFTLHSVSRCVSVCCTFSPYFPLKQTSRISHILSFSKVSLNIHRCCPPRIHIPLTTPFCFLLYVLVSEINVMPRILSYPLPGAILTFPCVPGRWLPEETLSLQPSLCLWGKAVGFQIKPPASPSPHTLLGEPSKVSIIHLSLQAQTGCLEKQVLSQGFWQVLKYFLLCD